MLAAAFLYHYLGGVNLLVFSGTGGGEIAFSVSRNKTERMIKRSGLSAKSLSVFIKSSSYAGISPT
jgi:hypothetical protein